MKPADLGRRSLAAIIDCIVVLVLWSFVVDTWGRTAAEIWGPAQGPMTSPAWSAHKYLDVFPAMLFLGGIAVAWIVLEWLTGATLGKWACGLRVVNKNGGRISLWQSVKRNLLRPVDAFPFYLIGFVTAKLNAGRQRLGDLWADTLVVMTAEMRREAAMGGSGHS
jgi:uncharacterized RDD family membrane protein YckC